jgi:hypothetical protein
MTRIMSTLDPHIPVSQDKFDSLPLPFFFPYCIFLFLDGDVVLAHHIAFTCISWFALLYLQ